MTHGACPRCTAEQADWLLCQHCSNRLARQLENMPALLHELEVTLTRRSRMGGDARRQSERPLPFDVTSSLTADSVRLELWTWVQALDLGDAHTLNGDPRGWCRWLRERLQRIRGHEAVDEIAEGIDYFSREIMRVIDRPPEKEFCGTCEECGADLYAKHGAIRDVCRRCRAAGIETEYDPQARREEVKSRVEHQWATAAVCATVLSNFGLEVKAETVQNWAREGKPRVGGDPIRAPKLYPRGRNQLGHALYLVGDVMDLAREHQARRARVLDRSPSVTEHVS